MKTLLISTFSLLVFFMKAQDAGLPQASCRIYLHSGKTIKDARPWRLENGTMEYLKDESLHDIPMAEINYLGCPTGHYRVSDSLKLVKTLYDVLISTEDDSIQCYIKEIGPNFIIYTLPGRTRTDLVAKSSIKKYLLQGKEEEVIHYSPKKPAPESKKENTDTITDTLQNESEHGEEKEASIDYFEKGKKDAQNEYRGNGAVVGGLFCGIIPIVGWITMPITLAVKPGVRPLDHQLFYTNKQYARGYKLQAYKKKVTKTLVGFFTGAIVLLALTHS